MTTTILSSKGQLIIPKTVRSKHHWQAGTVFVVEDTEAGLLLKPRKTFPTSRIEDGLGCAGYQGPPKSLEEIQEGLDAAVRSAWRKRKRP
jgi:AbrB family looped-hinge helix DNA binding protein